MHKRSSAHTHHDTLLAGLTALLLLAFSPTRTAATESEETESVAELFEIFWSGTAEEREWVAIDCEDVADEIMEFSASPEEGVDLLTAVLDAEPDPWIRFTCLLSLTEYSDDSNLNSYFVHLLAEGRPADIWPAVLWFTEEEDAGALRHLQALWPATNRPWLRPLLVEALAWQESMDHVDEFLFLAQSREPEEAELAEAAINALGILGDEAAIPVLLRLSGIDGPLGAQALDALSAWPESGLARDGLLHFLEHGKAGQRSVALESLHQFDHPDVLQARLKIAEETGASRGLRLAAIEGLSAEDDPAVFPVLRSIATGTSPGNVALEAAAWKVLKFNAQVVHDESLIYFVSNNSPFAQEIVTVSTACSFGRTTNSASMQPGLLVTPSEGLSVRCWAGPDRGVPWDGYTNSRVPAGYPVEIDAVYEGATGTLVLDYDEECWLPLEQLTWRRLQPEEDELAFFWDDPTAAEFDIPMDETYSDTALRLQDAGLLELFDPGPEIIGAALVLDENRPELRDLLLLFSEAGDAPILQEALAETLEELDDEEQHEP
jgi:hypothetical protein